MAEAVCVWRMRPSFSWGNPGASPPPPAISKSKSGRLLEVSEFSLQKPLQLILLVQVELFFRAAQCSTGGQTWSRKSLLIKERFRAINRELFRHFWGMLGIFFFTVNNHFFTLLVSMFGSEVFWTSHLWLHVELSSMNGQFLACSTATRRSRVNVRWQCLSWTLGSRWDVASTLNLSGSRKERREKSVAKS